MIFLIPHMYIAGTSYNQEGGQSLSNCTDCIPGSYSDVGAGECSLCSTGTYSPNPGTVIGGCFNCSAGKYLNEEGGISSSNCTNCKSGSYSGAGYELCLLCGKGKYSETPSTILGGCSSCPAGTALNILGGNSLLNCTNCTSGTSSSEGNIIIFEMKNEKLKNLCSMLFTNNTDTNSSLSQ